MLINFNDFDKVKMCVGTIKEAEAFPQAHKPAYQLSIDFGDLGIKKSSAQITHHYTPQELIGKQIIAVVNFPKKQIANFMSEVLVLGFETGGGVVLASPDNFVKNGTFMS